MVVIAGRLVYVSTGTKTQTINVCFAEQPARGEYEFVFRISDTSIFLSEDALLEIQFVDLCSFREFLKKHPATEETPGETQRPTAELLCPADEMPVGISDELDKCVNDFLDDFLARPYKHRSEHSIHIDLFNRLSHVPGIADKCVNIADAYTSPLVHKEWPEPRPIGGAIRRGSHDIAVLRPCRADIDQFRFGLIEPYAALEVGLNSGLGHFEKDIFTLHYANLAASYVVHLSRAEATDQEFIIEKTKQLVSADHDGLGGWPKLAVAVIGRNGEQHVKYAGETAIKTVRRD